MCSAHAILPACQAMPARQALTFAHGFGPHRICSEKNETKYFQLTCNIIWKINFVNFLQINQEKKIGGKSSGEKNLQKIQKNHIK